MAWYAEVLAGSVPVHTKKGLISIKLGLVPKNAALFSSRIAPPERDRVPKRHVLRRNPDTCIYIGAMQHDEFITYRYRKVRI